MHDLRERRNSNFNLKFCARAETWSLSLIARPPEPKDLLMGHHHTSFSNATAYLLGSLPQQLQLHISTYQCLVANIHLTLDPEIFLPLLGPCDR
jgi:hypothetical protein